MERNMDFVEITKQRQSCRSYNPEREVEEDKLMRILSAARLAPSACNGQPYRITVCRGEVAKEVERATQGMGMNKFSTSAPTALVISEESYVASAALGAKLKGNDYRSIDIGIVTAYITAAATELGLSTCILGWFDEKRVKQLLSIPRSKRVLMIISLGYSLDARRQHIRKPKEQMSSNNKY